MGRDERIVIIYFDKIGDLSSHMSMSKSSNATRTLPYAAAEAARLLGENLRIARQRRGESLRAWAQRMDASVATVQRMERGDPTVGMGVYVTALWLFGRIEDLPAIMSPERDLKAAELEVIRATSRGRRA